MIITSYDYVGFLKKVQQKTYRYVLMVKIHYGPTPSTLYNVCYSQLLKHVISLLLLATTLMGTFKIIFQQSINKNPFLILLTNTEVGLWSVPGRHWVEMKIDLYELIVTWNWKIKSQIRELDKKSIQRCSKFPSCFAWSQG